MLLRLPTSVSEARECLAEGAVPIGGATLLWAEWQRDGFPERAMSLRGLPQANVIGGGTLGAAVVLNRIDDRVPDVLRLAAAAVGTGAVRRTATVGGNLVGSTLRCLLPAALVLDARASVLGPEGVQETDLAEVTAKRPLLLSLHWHEPVASSYRKLPAEAGGRPPLAVALALYTDGTGHSRLHAAVRDGYDVISDSTMCDTGGDEALHALHRTGLGDLPPTVWETVSEQVTELLRPAADRRAGGRPPG
ncbi:FAD binding domain-containing protein [Streptomyces sp. NPDC007905]|uniref:FAD binding domain-containing protein n=1 Tax=Streptomyces sp. NPDC007905 TaxID=3364788 RepID=UPI0036E05588